MDKENQTQQKVGTLEGPLEVNFTTTASLHTAGHHLEINKETKTVIVPKGANVTVQELPGKRRNLNVAHNGINMHWSFDTIKSVTQEGKKIF
jgi:hypothetical protein